MKFLLMGLLLSLTSTSYSQVPLPEAVGHTLLIVKEISVPPRMAGVHFQNGQPITDVGKIDYAGGPVCFLAKYSGQDFWDKNKIGTSFKAGTVFILTKAWKNTTTNKIMTGYTFTTNNTEVYSLVAEPVADWIDAPLKVTNNPELLDIKIIHQCFGDYVAISQ